MKRLAVVIATSDPARIAEALRAAVGLGLRGDHISVVALHPIDAKDAKTSRLLAALRSARVPLDAPLSITSEADAVEVWT